MYVYLSGQFAYDINDNCMKGVTAILPQLSRLSRHSRFAALAGSLAPEVVTQAAIAVHPTLKSSLIIHSNCNHFPAKCAISKQIEKQTKRGSNSDRERETEREKENRKTNLVTAAETVAGSRSRSWSGSGSGSGTRGNGEFSRSFVSIDDCQSEQI